MSLRLARFTSSQETAVSINALQVLYIADRDDGHVFIHFEADNKILVKGTMAEVEQTLNQASAD